MKVLPNRTVMLQHGQYQYQYIIMSYEFF